MTSALQMQGVGAECIASDIISSSIFVHNNLFQH